jgi:hypothetical protein
MHIAILTFEGFNELDSLVAFSILNRVKRPAWRVSIACPSSRVRSMNGVVIEAQLSLREASAADAVIVGSGMVYLPALMWRPNHGSRKSASLFSISRSLQRATSLPPVDAWPHRIWPPG